MNDEEKENSLINSLTKYLKYYKNSFHAQLSLLQAIFLDSQQALNVFSKIKANTYEFQIDNKALEITVGQQNWKQVQRFCLRINQYLDYRLLKTKSLPDKLALDDIENYQISLYRLFSQLNKQIKRQAKKLSYIFERIDDLEQKCVKKLLKRINMKNNCGIEKADIDEISFFLNKNFRNKFLRIKQSFSFFDEENPQTLQRKQRKAEKFYKIEHLLRKSKFKKVNPETPKVGGRNATSFSTVDAPQQYVFKNISFRDRIKISDDHHLGKEGIQGYIRKNKAFQTNIEDIMQIQRSIKMPENRLFEELLMRNKKNMVMIQKFKLKAERKKRLPKKESFSDKHATISSLAQLPKKKSDRKSKLPSIKKNINP